MKKVVNVRVRIAKKEKKSGTNLWNFNYYYRVSFRIKYYFFNIQSYIIPRFLFHFHLCHCLSCLLTVYCHFFFLSFPLLFFLSTHTHSLSDTLSKFNGSFTVVFVICSLFFFFCLPFHSLSLFFFLCSNVICCLKI